MIRAALPPRCPTCARVRRRHCERGLSRPAGRGTSKSTPCCNTVHRVATRRSVLATPCLRSAGPGSGPRADVRESRRRCARVPAQMCARCGKATAALQERKAHSSTWSTNYSHLPNRTAHNGARCVAAFGTPLQRVARLLPCVRPNCATTVCSSGPESGSHVCWSAYICAKIRLRRRSRVLLPR